MPQPVVCPDSETLQQFLLGRISEAKAADMELHVADCERCREWIERRPVEDDLVRAMRRRSPLLGESHQQPSELIERIRQLWTTLSLDGCDLSARNRETGPMVADATVEPIGSQRAYDFLEPPRNAGELGWLGPYCVKRVLGRGGMGVVFQAVDPRLGREVALKVLLDARYTDPNYVARFEREVEALSRLQHPNIVRVYEAGQFDGRPYLALEYVSGGTLAQRLSTRPMGIAESAAWMETVARAVEYAHSQGILHRDLKPSNILLAGMDQRPMVADFGLAKRADNSDLTHTGDVLGTPGYMAPELARGGKHSTAAVDVYSLGAILYELLVGRPPFRGETPFETLAQARTSDPIAPRRLRPALPRDLETICLKCLAREPHKRFASPGEFADDLRRFQRHEPIRARPTSSAERVLKWTRRNTALASLILVSGVSALALVGGSLWYNKQLRSTLRQVEHERSRADAGYRSARDTLNRLLSRLEGRNVSEAPHLRDLQRELLQDALSFYTSVMLQGSESDPAVQRDSAVAAERAGTIELMLGRWDDADKHFQQCLNLIAGLPAERREAAENQTLLVGCHNNMGLLANNHRRWDEAERHHLQAMEISERLARQWPNAAEHRHGIAQSALNVGAVYQLSGQLDKAEKQLSRARDMHTELVKDFPNKELYISALAHDCENLALLHQNTDRSELAIQEHERANTLLRPLVARQPLGGEHALTLAAVCINWAYCHRAAGEMETAQAKYSEAVELSEAILQQEPNHVVARARAYQAHGARAELYDALGRHAEAVFDWDRAVELDTQTDAWMRRLFRAISQVRAGHCIAATTSADALLKEPGLSDEGLYNVACVYALAAAQSSSDPELDDSVREKTGERFAEQAMSVLRKLAQQGYFQAAPQAKALQTDADLSALRNRADFRELLNGKDQAAL